MISLAPTLQSGKRTYTIVFKTNAPDPNNFDGVETGNLGTDANSEIWIYQLPAVADVDLTLGADFFQDLNLGTFFQVTNTPASRAPTAGSTTVTPFFADDNRECTISDDGKILAFISTRDLVPGVGNADFNPELFLYNISSGAFTQGTKTQDAVPGIGFIFNSNPNLSADGSIIAFSSSANLATNNADNNTEIFMADFSGGAVSNIFQVTRTLGDANSASVNVASPGRRLSRDGGLIAFESRATDPKANTAATSLFLGMFVYTRATDSFVEVGPRGNLTVGSDIGRFPTFTDYNASLVPSSLVFASFLNFRPDGTIPATAQALEGLNPQRSSQVFITSLPATATNTFTRLTNTPIVVSFGGTRPMPSETRKRIVFALGGAEFGTGNSDGSIELYYLLTPQITATSSAALSFFTGASEMPVAAATPLPSPTPSPTATPSPVPGAPAGVAAGELTIVRSTIPLAAASGSTTGEVSETKRSPALPIELNGVSVSVDGAAAGLYFVGATEKQINFVVPVAVRSGLGIVAVNILDGGANTDTLVRGQVQIVPGQPDIFAIAGRALAFNVTKPLNRTPEPFNVTSTNDSGATVPTVIELNVTGLRNALVSEVSVTVGTTAIPAAQILSVKPNLNMPGWDIVNFSLPSSLAGAGDVPVIVTFTRAGFTATSRPADSAPKIHIN